MVESLRVIGLQAQSQCRVIQNFKLFLYIFSYRSTSGPSMAIGPPVDLQGLQVRQWTFSGYRSASELSVAIGPPADLQWL